MGQLDVFDTTNELLDKYARKFNLETDYQIAKHLGCTTGTISNYRSRKTKMDPTTCVQIAEAIRIDPMLVIGKIKMESNPTKREDRVWGKYAGRAFLLAAALSAFLTTYDSANAQKPHVVEDHHIHYAHLFAQICARFRRIANHFFGGSRCEPHSKRTSRCDSQYHKKLMQLPT